MKELRQIVRDASMASAGVTLATTSMSTSASGNSDASLEQLKSLLEMQHKNLQSVSDKVRKRIQQHLKRTQLRITSLAAVKVLRGGIYDMDFSSSPLNNSGSQ
jgi:hypothetical protein